MPKPLEEAVVTAAAAEAEAVEHQKTMICRRAWTAFGVDVPHWVSIRCSGLVASGALVLYLWS